MKTLKKILIAIVIIVAIPFIIALFVKKEYSVKRDVTIQKTNTEVFDYLKHLKNQDNFSKWAMMDPTMDKEFRGTDGTVGFIYAWDSEEAGKGEQEIKSLSEGERIDLDLRFIKPFESKATAAFTTKTISPSETNVSWEMHGKSDYPMNFMNLFMDSMLGKDLETSLATLKTTLEKQ
ncbi:MAG: SRPBCC family protein [Sphingobacteriaceae bacterium]